MRSSRFALEFLAYSRNVSFFTTSPSRTDCVVRTCLLQTCIIGISNSRFDATNNILLPFSSGKNWLCSRVQRLGLWQTNPTGARQINVSKLQRNVSRGSAPNVIVLVFLQKVALPRFGNRQLRTSESLRGHGRNSNMNVFSLYCRDWF